MRWASTFGSPQPASSAWISAPVAQAPDPSSTIPWTWTASTYRRRCGATSHAEKDGVKRCLVNVLCFKDGGWTNMLFLRGPWLGDIVIVVRICFQQTLIYLYYIYTYISISHIYIYISIYIYIYIYKPWKIMLLFFRVSDILCMLFAGFWDSWRVSINNIWWWLTASLRSQLWKDGLVHHTVHGEAADCGILWIQRVSHVFFGHAMKDPYLMSSVSL